MPPRRRRRSSRQVQAAKAGCIINWLCAIPAFTLYVLVGFSRPNHSPKFYIQEFYVPALYVSPDNPFSNITRSSNTIFFDVKLQNSMSYKGVRYYSDLNLTFSYLPNATLPAPILLANYTVPRFYQGYGNAAMRRDVVVAPELPWEEAIRAVSGGSTAVFRVDLAANVKFKFFTTYYGRRKLKVAAEVEVNGSGRKAQKDAIRFINSAK